MIAEPWDTAGYQVGGFPADWSEWNGKFRDDVRDVLERRARRARRPSRDRVLGSPDVYEGDRRSPLSSVNFVTAHDGFTLADLTAYAEKHNEANGEDNNDGESDNKSVQRRRRGPDRRRRRQRVPRPSAPQLPRHAAAQRRRADDPRRRRDRPHARAATTTPTARTTRSRGSTGSTPTSDLLGFTTRPDRAAPSRTRRCAPTGSATRPRSRATTTSRCVVPTTTRSARATGPQGENKAITFVLTHEAPTRSPCSSTARERSSSSTCPTRPGGEWELASSSDPDQQVEGAVTTLLVRDASFTLLRSRAS